MSFFYVFDLLIGDYHFIGKNVFLDHTINFRIELANERQPLHPAESIESARIKVKLQNLNPRVGRVVFEVLGRVDFGGGRGKAGVAEENLFGLARRQ